MRQIKILFLIIFVLALAGFASGCTKKSATLSNADDLSMNQVANQGINNATSTSVSDEASLKTYNDNFFDFQFDYPGNFIVSKDKSGTVTFKNPTKDNEGFIVSVWNNYFDYDQGSDFVRSVTNRRNQGIFDYYFSNDKVQAKSYDMVHWLWNYKDTLGINTYSELLLFNKKYDYGVSIMAFTSATTSTQINDVLYSVQNSFQFNDKTKGVTTSLNNWKKYEGDGLNFKFIYPSTWKINDTSDYNLLFISIPVCDNQVSQCLYSSITITDHKLGVSNAYLNDGDIPADYQMVKKDENLVVYVEKDLFKTEFKKQVSFYIKTKDGIYSGEWQGGALGYITDEEEEVAYKKIYIASINEFANFKKFLQSIEYNPQPLYDINSNGWSTYENTDFGLKFRYPSGWNVDKNYREMYPNTYLIVSMSAPGKDNLGLWIYQKLWPPSTEPCRSQFNGMRACTAGDSYSRIWNVVLNNKNISIVLNYNYDLPDIPRSNSLKGKLEYILGQVENSIQFIK